MSGTIHPMTQHHIPENLTLQCTSVSMGRNQQNEPEVSVSCTHRTFSSITQAAHTECALCSNVSSLPGARHSISRTVQQGRIDKNNKILRKGSKGTGTLQWVPKETNFYIHKSLMETQPC